MRAGIAVLAAAWLAGCAAPAPAPLSIVPQAERERAQASAGPKENRGIEAVKPLGTVDLSGELDGAGDRMLRAREIAVAPGGIVAVHQHDQRPGVAYIIEGEMTEFRGDPPQPTVHRAGSVAFERTGVTHWWENRGSTTARALVVDIVPAEAR